MCSKVIYIIVLVGTSAGQTMQIFVPWLEYILLAFPIDWIKSEE